MYIFTRARELTQFLQEQKNAGKKVGFIPTMGALHHGHLSLVNASNKENDLSVVSIFVNPTQFNETSDLENYPRTIGKDLTLLREASCDVCFIPSVAEIYPPDFQDSTEGLDIGEMTTVMEGAFRPGHFDGMLQVVKRLLDIAIPDALYMGQKDFQQQSIVRRMITLMNLPVKLVMCPIIRDEDGLAKSSRNTRLTPENRTAALNISATLNHLQEQKGKMAIDQLIEDAMNKLKEVGLKPEYVELSDTISLLPVRSWDESSEIVACIAAWAGDVRLIDNKIL